MRNGVSNQKKYNYSSYVAMLSQSSTSDPTATVLENTIGGDFEWTREGVGTYRITNLGAFPTNKIFINCVYGGESNNVFAPYLIESEDYIEFINRLLLTGSAGDGLQNAFVEIRIYP